MNANTVVQHEAIEGAALAEPAADVETAPLLSSPVTDGAGAGTVSAPTDSVGPAAEATTVLATLLSPLLGTLPGGEPVESPALWVALAAARRELGRTENTEPIVAPLLTTSEVDVAAAVTDQPPVITPHFDDPALVTGALTGTVGAVDPEHKALTYKLVSGPSAGAFTFDAKTGAFTFTPTAAQRILAGLPGAPQTADFKITISDGVNLIPATVQVPISPTSIADAGTISTGKNTISVVATNTRAYVTNDDNTITVIDTVNRTVVDTISFGDDEPLSLAVSPDGKKLYVTVDGFDSITVINTATNEMASSIALGGRYPLLMAFSPDGKTLYTTTTDERTGGEIPTITKISTATGKVTGTVQLPDAIASFYDLAVTPDGKKVYVIADLNALSDDGIPLSGLFTFSSTATQASLVADGFYFVNLQISPDGSRVYVNDVDASEINVFDVKSNTLTNSVDTSEYVLGALTLNRDGSVLLGVDTLTNSVVALDTTTGLYGLLTSVATGVTTDGYLPLGVRSPDGTQLYYLADNGAVQVISLVPAAAARAIGAPVLKPADPTTGAVTGTVASTPPGAKLTYTVVSGPATGTLVFNKTTGAFTYTPTTALRVLAGVSPEAATIQFTVTAFDGKTTVPLMVTVQIDPVTPAKLGDVGVGHPGYAIASTNTRIYVTDIAGNLVTVIDSIHGTVLDEIEVGNGPTAIAVTPDGSKVYVTNSASNSVSVIDTASGTVIKTIALPGKSPGSIAASPDGKTIYVGAFAVGADGLPARDSKGNFVGGTITKISTSTNKVTSTMKGVGVLPASISISPDGKKIYVVGYDADPGTLQLTTAHIYVASSTSTTAKALTGLGNHTDTLVLGADNKRIYVADSADPNGAITVLETTKYASIGAIEVGTTLVAMSTNKDGSLLLVNDSAGAIAFFDTATFGYLTELDTGYTPAPALVHPLVISPDGMQAYSLGSNAVQVISLVPPNAFPTAVLDTINAPTSTGVVTGSLTIDRVDGDILKITATKPAKGAVVLNADGTFTYTPTALARHAAATGIDGTLTDTFTVTVDDSRRGIATVEVTVDILPANIDPSAKGTVANPSSTTGVVKGSITATDKDKDKLTYTATTPANGTVTFTSTGGFTYTPTAAARHAAATGDPAALADAFTVTVDDGHGGITTVPIAVKIAPQNAKPTAKATVSQYDPGSGAVTVTIAVTDTDLDAFSYTTSATTKGAIDRQSSTFTYTPTAAARAAAMLPGASTATKTDTITITVKDGHGGITATSVKISLAPPLNHPPVAGSPKFKITKTDTVTGVVTGQVNITDADNNTIAYSLAAPVDPTIGTVVVNTATGAFTFTPTLQARLNAWATPSTAPKSIAFTVTAGDGAATANVAVTAAISPLAKQRVSSAIAVDGTPFGVAADASGRLFITSVHTEGPAGGGDPSKEGLIVVNPNGTVARVINLGGTLSDVEIGPDGRLYMTDISAGTVSAVDPANNYQAKVLANVEGAAALAFDDAGHLYVTSVAVGTPTATLQILNLDGSTAADPIALTTFAGGQFSDGLAVGPDGRIYVTSFAPFVDGNPPSEFRGALTVLDANGRVIKTIDIDGLAVQPSGVVIAPTGVVYVTDGYSGVVAIDPADGVLYRIPVGTGTAGPFGITIGKNGKIYVTTPGSGVVSVLTPSPSPNIA